MSEAQDFVISSNIAGGSSVFAFPKSRKEPKKYARSSGRSSGRRSVSQRTATRRQIRRQYDNLAKVTNRRKEIKVIKPEDLIPREDPVKASLALTGAGQYYFNENQVDKAILYFRQAYDLNSKNDLARLSLSDSLTRKADELMEGGDTNLKFAVPLYNEAVKLNDVNSAAFAGLGETYEELEENDNAIDNYEKALKIDPSLTQVNGPLGILYYRRGDIAKAEILLKKALADQPDDVQTQYYLGLVQYDQNQDQAAEKSFRKAVSLDPTSAEGHYYLGAALVRLGNEKEAIGEFKEAIRLDPKKYEAWFDLGSIYYNAEQYKESVDAYQQTVRLKNNYTEAYINLGDGYRQLADSETGIRAKYDMLGRAIQNYNLAQTFINNNPKEAEQFTQEELADLNSRFGFTAGERNMAASALGFRNDWTQAIELLTKAAEINNDALDYTNLGWAYYNSARIDLKPNPAAAKDKLLKAKANLEKAKSLNPNQMILTAIRLNLGITLIDLGDFKGAVENLKPVTESRKDWAFANYSLGVAYFQDGDLDDAIKQFTKAVDTEEKYVPALSGLGNAYLKQGKKKDVEKVIDKLKKVGTRDAINEANKLQFAISLMK
ncbi:MAG: tetratricopeptide repeat protein [Pyrinomonadaceae bacterium]